MVHLLLDGQEKNLCESLVCRKREGGIINPLFDLLVLDGTVIETCVTSKNIYMKKPFTKLITASLKKIKQHKEQLKRFSFSNYREDFVITSQEEKEGGFFGRINWKTNPA